MADTAITDRTASDVERIYREVKESGIKMAVFARRLGISRTQLYNYWAGADPMPPHRIRRACEILHIPLDEIEALRTPSAASARDSPRPPPLIRPRQLALFTDRSA